VKAPAVATLPTALRSPRTCPQNEDLREQYAAEARRVAERHDPDDAI